MASIKQVIVVLDHAATGVAVERGVQLARALDCELRVVVCGSDVTQCDRVAGLVRSRGLEVVFHPGSRREAAIEIGLREPTELVVLGTDAGEHGATALAIVDVLRVPVLVARASSTARPIVAATAMTHRDFPVLEAARRLALRLGRPLSFFHNVVPAPVFSLPARYAIPGLSPSRMDDVTVALKLHQLRMLAENGNIDARVSRSNNTVEAIREVVRELDADIVAIGYCPRSWLGRRRGRQTTERAIDRRLRSVMVVPCIESEPDLNPEIPEVPVGAC